MHENSKNSVFTVVLQDWNQGACQSSHSPGSRQNSCIKMDFRLMHQIGSWLFGACDFAFRIVWKSLNENIRAVHEFSGPGEFRFHTHMHAVLVQLYHPVFNTVQTKIRCCPFHHSIREWVVKRSAAEACRSRSYSKN